MKHLFKGTDSAEAYMHRAKSMFDQLATLQNLLSDDVFVNNILERFGPEYCPFVRAIKACNSLLSYDELFSLLLSEKMQLKLKKVTVVNSILPIAKVVVHTSGTYDSRFHARGG